MSQAGDMSAATPVRPSSRSDHSRKLGMAALVGFPTCLGHSPTSDHAAARAAALRSATTAPSWAVGGQIGARHARDRPLGTPGERQTSARVENQLIEKARSLWFVWFSNAAPTPSACPRLTEEATVFCLDRGDVVLDAAPRVSAGQRRLHHDRSLRMPRSLKLPASTAVVRIVGLYLDAEGTIHGFLRDKRHGARRDNGVFTTIELPGALATSADDINN